MAITLVSPHWAANARIQRAANNSPAMGQGEADKAAVTLLQQALVQSGFPVAGGVTGVFGPQTTAAVTAAQKHFGFSTVFPGIAGHEVLGALDLSLRGWKPLQGPHWGGELAKTIVPLALRKVDAALFALNDFRGALAVAPNSLKCKLFRGDPKLEACLVSDPAHVVPGSQGDHVGKIQQALFLLGAGVIGPKEIGEKKFGPDTLRAVRAFKGPPRNIINRSYQSTPDDIVGKMTIATLDREMFSLDFVLVLSALKTHFKLVLAGATLLFIEEPITVAAIDQLTTTFLFVQRTLRNANMIKHSICLGNGISTAAEAPLGGPVVFGPPYSDFTLAPVGVTNIAKTGPNSLAAIMIHEATHVIDNLSGDNATTHISEFSNAYAAQSAANARHNPSAYATFAAHIFDRADRLPENRFGLSQGGRAF
jgi:peptidoglycan hydrolase-like protein with peptidoglycan-binding domain